MSIAFVYKRPKLAIRGFKEVTGTSGLLLSIKGNNQDHEQASVVDERYVVYGLLCGDEFAGVG